jgi:hypothetical protein
MGLSREAAPQRRWKFSRSGWILIESEKIQVHRGSKATFFAKCKDRANPDEYQQ